MIMTRASLDNANHNIITKNIKKINMIWFNQIYIGKMYKEGDKVLISGKANIEENGSMTFTNPYIESPPV